MSKNVVMACCPCHKHASVDEQSRAEINGTAINALGAVETSMRAWADTSNSVTKTRHCHHFQWGFSSIVRRCLPSGCLRPLPIYLETSRSATIVPGSV